MVVGFFLGTTVGSIIRKSAKLDRFREWADEKDARLVMKLRLSKETALADRYAAIKAAQDDIDAINRLS